MDEAGKSTKGIRRVGEAEGPLALLPQSPTPFPSPFPLLPLSPLLQLTALPFPPLLLTLPHDRLSGVRT